MCSRIHGVALCLFNKYFFCFVQCSGACSTVTVHHHHINPCFQIHRNGRHFAFADGLLSYGSAQYVGYR